MKDYKWLDKKKKLSVDYLRPWANNPRLNPEESHVHISDYAEDMIGENKGDFLDLIKSISESGFLPIDPLVVWQDEDNEKYYVAEGNRRLIALKLLRDPNKAPKSVRATVRKLSDSINLDSIKKVPVYVAPKFEDAEWYINQRNSKSSLQRKWSTIQQLRWVANLYKKYEGDIVRLQSVISLEESELNKYIRILKIWEFVNLTEVKAKLTPELYEKATSYRFPVSVLERFFSSVKVRELWGIEFDGVDVLIKSNKASFYNAYAELIRKIVEPNDDEIKIDTRTITSHFEEIIKNLPTVDLENTTDEPEPTETNEEIDLEEDADESTEDEPVPNPVLLLKNDPNRKKLVLPIYKLNTDSTRLAGLFYEFKKIPVHLYPNSVAASLRVFLDLSVLNYIMTEGLETDMQRDRGCSLREIQLKARIEYIKVNKLNGKVQNIASRLIDERQQFSLDVLNGFVHSPDTHYMSKENLNRFWDFLFPLFEFLLDITEENV